MDENLLRQYKSSVSNVHLEEKCNHSPDKNYNWSFGPRVQDAQESRSPQLGIAVYKATIQIEVKYLSSTQILTEYIQKNIKEELLEKASPGLVGVVLAVDFERSTVSSTGRIYNESANIFVAFRAPFLVWTPIAGEEVTMRISTITKQFISGFVFGLVPVILGKSELQEGAWNIFDGKMTLGSKIKIQLREIQVEKEKLCLKGGLVRNKV